MKRALALLLLLGGCGLKPIYAAGDKGAAAQTLSSIAITPIVDRGGYFLEQQLRERLRPEGNPRYRLDIKLDDSIEGFGIRGDNSIARERRTLRARWQLVDIASGNVVIDATARSDAGIDVVASDYAIITAENAALERLARALAEQISAHIAREARQP